MTLLDVGVWLAAVWGRHVHHRIVAAWFDQQDDGLVMCRVTQMSLLRLLTNPSVMRSDVVTRSEAWGVVHRLRDDDRIVWSAEPAQIEQVWRALSAHDDDSHKLWTDDYLAAFAQAGGVTLTTLDGGFATRYPYIRVQTLR